MLRHGLSAVPTLVPAERVALHRQIANALAATGAPAAELADQSPGRCARGGARRLRDRRLGGEPRARVHGGHVHLERASSCGTRARRLPTPCPWTASSCFRGRRKRRASAATSSERSPSAAMALDSLDHTWRSRCVLRWSADTSTSVASGTTPPHSPATARRSRIAAPGRKQRAWPAAGGGRPRADGTAALGARPARRCEAAIAAAGTAGGRGADGAGEDHARPGVSPTLGEPARASVTCARRSRRRSPSTRARTPSAPMSIWANCSDCAGSTRPRSTWRWPASAPRRDSACALSFGRSRTVNAADALLRLGRSDAAEQRLAQAARTDLGMTTAALHLAVVSIRTTARRSPRAHTSEQALALADEGCRPNSSRPFAAHGRH